MVKATSSKTSSPTSASSSPPNSPLHALGVGHPKKRQTLLRTRLPNLRLRPSHPRRPSWPPIHLHPRIRTRRRQLVQIPLPPRRKTSQNIHPHLPTLRLRHLPTIFLRLPPPPLQHQRSPHLPPRHHPQPPFHDPARRSACPNSAPLG